MTDGGRAGKRRGEGAPLQAGRESEAAAAETLRAVFQSLLLLVQDHQLKNKHPSGLIRNFPPLQTMESLLFGFLWAGWTLLSLSLISGWLFVENLFAQHLVHKTLLACLAWIVFSVLLWGRNRLGWRGHKAIRWTLAGFCLLMLAYFGSKLVREYILHI